MYAFKMNIEVLLLKCLVFNAVSFSSRMSMFIERDKKSLTEEGLKTGKREKSETLENSYIP